jgi:hypothetical protein
MSEKSLKKIRLTTYLSRWGSTVPDNQLDISDTRPKQTNINLNTTGLWIRIRMILGLPGLDPCIRGTDLNPDPSIIKQK